MSEILPRIRTQKYYDFMQEFIAQLESVVPCKVYGFTDYSSLGIHWITVNEFGEEIQYKNPCVLPFQVAQYLIKKYKKENKNG